MGDIVRAGSAPMRLAAEVIGTAPVERVDVFEGKQLGGGGQPVGGSKSGSDLGIVEGGQEVRQGRDTQVTDQCEGLFVIRDAELDEAGSRRSRTGRAARRSGASGVPRISARHQSCRTMAGRPGPLTRPAYPS